MARTFRVNTPSGGKTLLYRRYRDARSRAHGRGTRTPWAYPKGWPWKCFAEFRSWALASGFTKTNNSPDRIRPTEPYGPGNVEWKPPRENYASSRGRGYYGAQPDGPEPPLDDSVPF